MCFDTVQLEPCEMIYRVPWLLHTHTEESHGLAGTIYSIDKECFCHLIPNTVERGLTGKHFFIKCICKGRKKESCPVLRIRYWAQPFPSKDGHTVHHFCNSVEVRAVNKDMQQRVEKESCPFGNFPNHLARGCLSWSS